MRSVFASWRVTQALAAKRRAVTAAHQRLGCDIALYVFGAWAHSFKQRTCSLHTAVVYCRMRADRAAAAILMAWREACLVERWQSATQAMAGKIQARLRASTLRGVDRAFVFCRSKPLLEDAYLAWLLALGKGRTRRRVDALHCRNTERRILSRVVASWQSMMQEGRSTSRTSRLLDVCDAAVSLLAVMAAWRRVCTASRWSGTMEDALLEVSCQVQVAQSRAEAAVRLSRGCEALILAAQVFVRWASASRLLGRTEAVLSLSRSRASLQLAARSLLAWTCACERTRLIWQAAYCLAAAVGRRIVAAAFAAWRAAEAAGAILQKRGLAAGRAAAVGHGRRVLAKILATWRRHRLEAAGALRLALVSAKGQAWVRLATALAAWQLVHTWYRAAIAAASEATVASVHARKMGMLSEVLAGWRLLAYTSTSLRECGSRIDNILAERNHTRVAVCRAFHSWRKIAAPHSTGGTSHAELGPDPEPAIREVTLLANTVSKNASVAASRGISVGPMHFAHSCREHRPCAKAPLANMLLLVQVWSAWSREAVVALCRRLGQQQWRSQAGVVRYACEAALLHERLVQHLAFASWCRSSLEASQIRIFRRLKARASTCCRRAASASDATGSNWEWLRTVLAAWVRAARRRQGPLQLSPGDFASLSAVSAAGSGAESPRRRSQPSVAARSSSPSWGNLSQGAAAHSEPQPPPAAFRPAPRPVARGAPAPLLLVKMPVRPLGRSASAVTLGTAAQHQEPVGSAESDSVGLSSASSKAHHPSAEHASRADSMHEVSVSAHEASASTQEVGVSASASPSPRTRPLLVTRPVTVPWLSSSRALSPQPAWAAAGVAVKVADAVAVTTGTAANAVAAALPRTASSPAGSGIRSVSEAVESPTAVPLPRSAVPPAHTEPAPSQAGSWPSMIESMPQPPLGPRVSPAPAASVPAAGKRTSLSTSAFAMPTPKSNSVSSASLAPRASLTKAASAPGLQQSRPYVVAARVRPTAAVFAKRAEGASSSQSSLPPPMPRSWAL